MQHTVIDADRKRLIGSCGIALAVYGSLFAVLILFPSFAGPKNSVREMPVVRISLASPASDPAIPEAAVGKGVAFPNTATAAPSAKNDNPAPAITDAPADNRSAVPDTGESAGFPPGSIIRNGSPVTFLEPALFSGWLSAEIKRKLVYPEKARRRNREGVVLVRIMVPPDGSRCEAIVVESSGSDILDRSAVELLKSLFPAPVAPGSEFAGAFKIEYILK